MPSSERRHCALTTSEKATSKEMHLHDWEEYQKSWDDEQILGRNQD